MLRFSTRSDSGDKRRIISIAELDSGKVFKTYAVEYQESSANDIVWMPDGKSFVYVTAATTRNNASLMLQPTADQTPSRIADLGEDRVNSVAVAPDGKSFAIVQGGWKHDMVLIQGLK
jgi:Tol biopolymer transport system component